MLSILYPRSQSLVSNLLQVLHGTDDQVVPIDATGRRSAKLAKKGKIKEFEGASHALPTTRINEVNQALLEFLQS